MKPVGELRSIEKESFKAYGPAYTRACIHTPSSTDYRRVPHAGFYNWGFVLTAITSLSGFVFVYLVTSQEEDNGARAAPSSLSLNSRARMPGS
jgi:hypothetical protein